MVMITPHDVPSNGHSGGDSDLARLSAKRQNGAEFAGGEGFECAEAGGEFGGGEAMLAIEAAEKVVGVSTAFGGVALDASGDEVAVGIAAAPGTWNDVVEAASAGIETAEAIETASAVTVVNGTAMCGVFEEINLFKVGRIANRPSATRERDMVRRVSKTGRWWRTSGANFVGQTDFNDVAFSAAFQHAEDAMRRESANGFASRACSET